MVELICIADGILWIVLIICSFCFAALVIFIIMIFMIISIAFRSFERFGNIAFLNQGSSGGGDGFEVTKYGHGRVALIGFPRYANFMICQCYPFVCVCL